MNMTTNKEFDIDAAAEAALDAVFGPSSEPVYEADMDGYPETSEKPIVEPLDLFGDTSLTGRQELTPGMLPPAIYDYSKDCAEIMGINTGAIALGCLVAAGTAIREKWVIQPKINDYNWKERAILWGGVSGNTGAKKTSAINASTVPLDILENKWDADAEELRQDFYQEKAVYNELMKNWRKVCQQILKDGGSRMDLPPAPEKPELPIVPRLVIKDTTIESVMGICANNPAGVVQVRDELAEWLASFDLYSGGSGSRDRAKYLSAYNGSSESIDRKSDEAGPLRVETFAVSVLGGIQDDLVRKNFQNTAADGFIARFLFVRAEIMDGCDRTPNKKAIAAYISLIHKLTELEVQEENNESPIVTMSLGAAKVRERVEALSRALNNNPLITKGLGDHLNKWPGIFSRLCLIFHMIECAQMGIRPTGKHESGEPVQVKETTAERAYTLMTEYFLPEAARIYNEVMQGDEATGHAKWIAGHILSGGKDFTRITASEIGRAYRALKSDTRALDDATRKLELMGWITPDVKKDGRPYHRSDMPKMKWRVNPQVHKSFADRAEIERQNRQATKDLIASGAKAMQELQTKIKR